MRSPYKITQRKTRLKKGHASWHVSFQDQTLNAEYRLSLIHI